MKAAGFIAAAIISISSVLFAAETQKASPLRLEQAQKILSADVPRVLCLDENFATGGQPTGDAYGKAAAAVLAQS